MRSRGPENRALGALETERSRDGVVDARPSRARAAASRAPLYRALARFSSDTTLSNMPAFTTRDGAKLHYLDVGRGRPCVMLHAFGMRASMWLPFVLPHANRHRFILLDFRGFGRSRGARLSGTDVL